MIDLKCNCTSCKNNINCNCKAKSINISTTTSCSNYSERRAQNTEFADEISQPLIRPSTEVECHAKCIFSRDGICIANGITVGEVNNNASCETFLRD